MVVAKRVKKEILCDKDKGFRRLDDIERVTKLEYVVYDNHNNRLDGHDEELKLVVKNQTQINNHLKTIKYVSFGLLIGAYGPEVGWTNVGQLLIKLIGT